MQETVMGETAGNEGKSRRHRIYCLMGKSASGKDTLYRLLLENRELGLDRIVPCTTRPIRQGEQNGREYFFYDVPQFEKMRADGRVIEYRCYPSAFGPWYYFTADDGQIDLSHRSVLLIGTLESYLALRRYFGADRVVPVYIEVEDGERLSRALMREKREAKPGYKEMCRRFLADCEDFSEEKLAEAGIDRRFENRNLEECLKEVKAFLRQEIVMETGGKP